MKKAFSLILVTGFLFLFGCTKPLPATIDANTGTITTGITDISSTGQTVPERQTYENKVDGFVIQFPGTWTFQEDVFDSAVMFFTPINEEDKIKENIGIIKKPLDKIYTLDEYYAITKPQLISLIQGFTEISNESIKISDIDAQKLIYTGTQGATNLKWEQVYLIKDTSLYIITYTATETTFDDYAKKIDEMLATLEIK